jgi:hypothetical protein
METSVDVETYTPEECAAFCSKSDQEILSVAYGTEECCDYEKWADFSYDCTLYKGGKTLPNGLAAKSQFKFKSMTFESGDYLEQSLVGMSKLHPENFAHPESLVRCFNWNGKTWVGNAP